MLTDKESTELLMQRICSLSGCTYLSDMPNKKNREHIKEAIKSIPTSMYHENAWYSLANYITGKDEKFASPEVAIAFIFED